MNSTLRVPLKTSPEEAAKLRQLQLAFATACNALAPIVQKTRVWNRVALHHMAYKPLPGLRFNDTSPVYFDRHTLSVKQGNLSMYTLDGRMRFQIGLSTQDEVKFRTHKLREVILTRQGESFVLV